jgi:hypothetical protein
MLEEREAAQRAADTAAALIKAAEKAKALAAK